MSPRSFLILAAATVVLVVAAFVSAIIEARVTGDVQLYDEPMYPRLVSRANDATKITYRTATEQAVIELKDGVWRFVQKDGYPVQTGNIRSVLAAVAALRKLEPKTDQANRYASLAVEDIGPEARSRELIIEAADGERLAAVVIGRTSNTMTFDPLGGTYVRVPGEARAWLVRGAVALPPTAVDWMERQIVHVPGPDVKTVQVYEDGKLALNTEKETDANGVVRYQLVPREEKTQAVDSAVKQVASGIVSLQFDDVKPEAKMKFPEGGREVVFTTFDGMNLRAQLAQIDGKTWTRFKVSTEPTATAPGKERAQQIAAATQGWLFQLPGFKAPAFNRPVTELVENKQAEPERNAPQPGLPPNFQIPRGIPGLGGGGMPPLPPGFGLQPPAVR